MTIIDPEDPMMTMMIVRETVEGTEREREIVVEESMTVNVIKKGKGVFANMTGITGGSDDLPEVEVEIDIVVVRMSVTTIMVGGVVMTMMVDAEAVVGIQGDLHMGMEGAVVVGGVQVPQSRSVG